ncbi:uncharacterized protein LOC136082239 [Hydra vulgaris]|uniref:Uncharacterized protein LOC136082239 n=1 Tax=Hydra vulgaris TaxID=6087 RepID=A0ABM4C5Q5_HYDVU
MFIPHTGRVISFVQSGVFVVEVTSQNGKYECYVYVADSDEKVQAPEIVSDYNGGSVKEGHKVFLSIDLQGADVYYTTDGTMPVIGDPQTKRYDEHNGVALENSGLKFVRAVALIKGTLPSKVLTSRRFWVKPLDWTTTDSANTSDEKNQPNTHKNKKTQQKSVTKSVKKEKKDSEVEYCTLKYQEHGGVVEKNSKVVSINSIQFKPNEVSIFEGEAITFQLMSDAKHLINQSIYQVQQSGVAVCNGFTSGAVLQHTQTWTQEFNCSNEYFFAFAEHPSLKVVVRPKPIIDVEVTDEGFKKPLLKLYKGDTIRWVWNDCCIYHSVTEVKYCLKHGGISV